MNKRRFDKEDDNSKDELNAENLFEMLSRAFKESGMDMETLPSMEILKKKKAIADKMCEELGGDVIEAVQANCPECRKVWETTMAALCGLFEAEKIVLKNKKKDE